MKRMMLIIAMALSLNVFAMNVKSKVENEVDSLATAVAAIDVKALAENDGLTDERRAAFEKEAAQATPEKKFDRLEFALHKYNLPEFNFWIKKGADVKRLADYGLNVYLKHGKPEEHLLDKLKILLKLGANPNKCSQFDGDERPLWTAVGYSNIEGAKILLTDPRTTLDQELSYNSYTLMMKAASACYHGGGSWTAEQRNCSHKKMVKLLLFMGFNATFARWSGKTAADDAKNCYRPDFADMIENHKKIEKYCTKEELAEFRHVMKQRKISHAYLVKRELDGPNAQVNKRKIAPTAAQLKSNNEPTAAHGATAAAIAPASAGQTAAAPAIKFVWPKNDSKDKN